MRGFFTSRLKLLNEVAVLRTRNELIAADAQSLSEENLRLLRENAAMRNEIDSILELNTRLKKQLNSQQCAKRLRDEQGRFAK